jgi:hypothetical protein
MYVKSSGRTQEQDLGRNHDGKNPCVAVDLQHRLQFDETLGFEVPNVKKRKEFHYSPTCFMMS